MSEKREEFECDYCGETHTMTLTEMELHLAKKLMEALCGVKP